MVHHAYANSRRSALREKRRLEQAGHAVLIKPYVEGFELLLTSTSETIWANEPPKMSNWQRVLDVLFQDAPEVEV